VSEELSASFARGNLMRTGGHRQAGNPPS